MLRIDTALVNNAQLARALDQLALQKDASCAQLMERYRQWFGVRFEFLLYIVTSSFSRARPSAIRWRSAATRATNTATASRCVSD